MKIITHAFFRSFVGFTVMFLLAFALTKILPIGQILAQTFVSGCIAAATMTMINIFIDWALDKYLIAGLLRGILKDATLGFMTCYPIVSVMSAGSAELKTGFFVSLGVIICLMLGWRWWNRRRALSSFKS